MGTREMKAPILSYIQIREYAEEFRSKYIHNEDIPVDIELIAESALGIRIIPLDDLRSDSDIDGLGSRDFKFIYVDKDQYSDDRYYNRIKFTIAHELAHYMLHREYIESLEINSGDEWIAFRLNMDEDELEWFERQANEFAGRLLVPIEPLVVIFPSVRDEITKKMSWMDKMNTEELITTAARKICNHFGISADVIERRLRKEETVRERLGL